LLERTRIGRIVRATAENRDMAEGLGVNASRIFALVFTVGCMLGTVGGALVGALIVGLMRASAISLMPELEMLSVYLVVVAVLILRPAGLFGKATA